MTAGVRELWAKVGTKAAITRQEFFEYFGRAGGSAWSVESPEPLPEPLSLSEIRAYDPDFFPPQSMQYLDENHAAFQALEDRGVWPK